MEKTAESDTTLWNESQDLVARLNSLLSTLVEASVISFDSNRDDKEDRSEDQVANEHRSDALAEGANASGADERVECGVTVAAPSPSSLSLLDVARDYQTELFLRAKRGNTVGVLGTGMRSFFSSFFVRFALYCPV
jgi:hypothetical protein